MHSTRYYRHILMKFEFSQQIFEKSSNIQLHENPPLESRVVPWGQIDGQTDGRTNKHDEANSRFSQFCEGAKDDIAHSICITVIMPQHL